MHYRTTPGLGEKVSFAQNPSGCRLLGTSVLRGREAHPPSDTWGLIQLIGLKNQTQKRQKDIPAKLFYQNLYSYGPEVA